MPKPAPTKLHSKGKSQALQKNSGCTDAPETEIDPTEATRKFELELCWCIQQLEKTLSAKQINEKQLQEAWKVMTVLKNNSQSTVRKRQLMRTYFGDYRAKMAAEEKKLAKMASQIRIQEAPPNPKATFLRKSVFMTSGNNSFHFNFNSENQTESGSNESDLQSNVTSDESQTLEKNKVDNPKAFKFKFTNSEFKFNFKVDE